ncbi:hypothetical protein AMJ40_03300 [candidate division TA06 bacterium DG_26]|uniref:Methyltransferase domain-containing protein n=1 Tax=candidate division TA06 bacterium DG_26 TaxID=1703771 RepID=A0A0S7WJG8_UNCT6|nr:MAG: hypothetical protein AMJ40_03300 [candidate division TA06 bacterium DG_26]
MKIVEEYVSNEEYETYYARLNGLRSRIVTDLPLQPGMDVLDVGTGEAFFAIEVARSTPDVTVRGIDISKRAIRDAKKNVKREGLQDRVQILHMDATRMTFPADEFDAAVNFTGMEDIHMTRGKAGVEQTFQEVRRVLRPGSSFCIVVMPPEEMETEAQRIEVVLFSYICNATWLPLKEYERMLDVAGFRIIGRSRYHTGKKLTSEQALAEIKFACKYDPIIYGIETPSVENVWKRFGHDIERHGLGHYSKVVLIAVRKPESAI